MPRLAPLSHDSFRKIRSFHRPLNKRLSGIHQPLCTVSRNPSDTFGKVSPKSIPPSQHRDVPQKMRKYTKKLGKDSKISPTYEGNSKRLLQVGEKRSPSFVARQVPLEIVRLTMSPCSDACFNANSADRGSRKIPNK